MATNIEAVRRRLEGLNHRAAIDNVQELNIALQMITRVRCSLRATNNQTVANREQSKRLNDASLEILEVLMEIKNKWLGEEE
jgi:hypothetical protein